MFTPTTHRNSPRLWHEALPQTTVCVVDSNIADYDAWRSTAAEAGLNLHFCATADEALRFARTQAVALWVVNTELAGISGPELCGMLKSRSATTPVYLVADDYSASAERAAWSARATLFGCKGEHNAWLAGFLQLTKDRNQTLTHCS